MHSDGRCVEFRTRRVCVPGLLSGKEGHCATRQTQSWPFLHNLQSPKPLFGAKMTQHFAI